MKKSKRAFSAVLIAVVFVSLLSYVTYDNREKLISFYYSVFKKPMAQVDFGDAFKSGAKTSSGSDNNSNDSYQTDSAVSVQFPYVTSTCDWEFTIHDIKLLDGEPEDIVFEDDSLNHYRQFLEEGERISDKFVYIEVDISIRNLLNEQRDNLINSLTIISLNENNLQVGVSELCGFKDAQKKGTQRFHYTFEPNASLRTRLIYIYPPQDMKDYDTYFHINMLGFGIFTDDQRLVKFFSKTGG